MATYSSTPVLSKIRIGTNDYYLKDADARTIIDSLGSAAYKNVDTSITASSTGVPQTSAIKDYVDSAVAVGLVIEVVTELPTASASTMGRIYLVSHSHGSGDSYDEYITVRSGASGSYTYAFEKIGNTDIDLSSYLTDIGYTASSHTLTKTVNKGSAQTVHTFGALADKSSASGTVSVAVGKSVTFTPSGSVVASTQAAGGTQVTGSVGSVTTIDSVGSLPSKTADAFTAGSLPSFTSGTFTANTPTAIDTTKFSGGSKAKDTFTAATLTKGTGNFNTDAMKASVDGETLVLSDASKSAAVNSITFSGGSFTEGAFTAAKLLDGFYTAGTAASKGADTFNAGSLPTFKEGAFSAGSLPTTKSVTPTFTGGYVKFSGTEQTETVATETKSYTVTVS